MTRKYAAFDLEIATDIPAGTKDWHVEVGPLGITAAALHTDQWVQVWPSMEPGTTTYSAAMSVGRASELVAYLRDLTVQGYTILTWNGQGFDFDVLAVESGLYEECKWLSLHHVDIMWHAFCLLGFPMGLDKAAQAMGTVRKTEGMHGDLAPQMWKDGKQAEVISYVGQDVRATLDLAHAIERRTPPSLSWITKSGYNKVVGFPNGLLTVEEAMKLPVVRTPFWPDNPFTREKFTGWMEQSPDANRAASPIVVC